MRKYDRLILVLLIAVSVFQIGVMDDKWTGFIAGAFFICTVNMAWFEVDRLIDRKYKGEQE